MTDKLTLHIDEKVATVTLNRPEKLNAIDPDMLEGLEEVLARLEKDTTVRVILLTGAGDRAFCVGADINAWASLSPADMWRQWINTGHRLFSRIVNLPQPVVAVLNGYTFGGGLELAMAADIRLAAEHVQLAMPEVTIGTVPGWAGTHRLPMLIGPARAREMILTGKRVEAERAEQWGLINEVFLSELLMKEARVIADKIAQNAPLSVQMAKKLINAAVEGSREINEGLAGAFAASTADGREGIAAFRERRPPRYTGE